MADGPPKPPLSRRTQFFNITPPTIDFERGIPTSYDYTILKPRVQATSFSGVAGVVLLERGRQGSGARNETTTDEGKLS